jgi:hypothetical protein
MMARLGIAGVVVVRPLGSALGLGCGRLDAQGREPRIVQGRQRFVDKGYHGCHTIGTTGTPVVPDLGRTGARHSEATLAVARLALMSAQSREGRHA